jgi:hypothetical protein
MMPLALKVVCADGHVSEKERQCMSNYFVGQWSFDAQFVQVSTGLIEPTLDPFKIATLAKDLIAFLKEVMESDGTIDEREELVRLRVESIFAEAEHVSVSDTVTGIKDAVAAKVRVSAHAVATGAQAAGVSQFQLLKPSHTLKPSGI